MLLYLEKNICFDIGKPPSTNSNYKRENFIEKEKKIKSQFNLHILV